MFVQKPFQAIHLPRNERLAASRRFVNTLLVYFSVTDKDDVTTPGRISEAEDTPDIIRNLKLACNNLRCRGKRLLGTQCFLALVKHLTLNLCA